MDEMNEPSILDYLKSRLNPWQAEKIELPAGPGSQEPAPALAPFPWRTLLALLMGLVAQWMLEPAISNVPLALGFYAFALILLAWSYFVNEFALPVPAEAVAQVDPLTYERNLVIAGGLCALVAFVLFTGNLFTFANVSIWLVSLGLFVRGLWLSDPQKPSVFERLRAWLGEDPLRVNITRWGLLLAALALVIIFFRFYRLPGIPGEPFSDHAEKLLDVYDVTQGQTHIFFPRNTGREFIQFYWTALLAWMLNTGLSFITLKIGTVLIGLFTLPYVYLLGKEVGGKRVAFFALALAGVSYWLNTISRIGLRFPLYPAFAAPALYYLIRGLRRQTRNDFILSGLFLGLGLHGYSPFRFVPFVILLGVGLYLLHRHSRGNRMQTLVMFTILVLASLLVFLPLLRYSIENPDNFSVRALSRLGGDGQPLPGPAWQIFLGNTFNAMTMFNVDDGEIWVHSVMHRPALDVVSAVLFVFGYILLFVRYLRRRDWLDLFLFLSVPMLLMPSILSLAFPRENPSLNRTGAAAVVVFLVCALALDGIYKALRGMHGFSPRRGLAIGAVSLLLLVSGLQNYNLVFVQFADQFMARALNSSDMGNVIRSFVLAGNSPDNAWVIPYPYWVDTRLVGIQAGFVTKDYAVWRENLPSTLSQSGAKLFIFKEEDQDTLTALKNLYPTGNLGHFISPLPDKNFWTYTVSDNQVPAP